MNGMNCSICHKLLNASELVKRSPYQFNEVCDNHSAARFWPNLEFAKDWFRYQKFVNKGRLRMTKENKIKFYAWEKEQYLKSKSKIK